MRVLAVVAVLVGCKDPVPVMPDATPPPPDARPDANFFGEPCDPPSTPTVTVLCRLDSEQPKGFCTPAGVCRPFCGYTLNGATYQFCPGNETWTLPKPREDGYHGICYCEP